MENIFKKINKRSLSYFISMKCFSFFERHLNLHITPADYYSPIPTLSELDPQVFDKVFADTGLDWNLSGQLDYLNSIFVKYRDEYTPSPNSGLSLLDSFVLYAMIRERKPQIMIEVGSGETTKISLQALDVNDKEGFECQFYAIEPYPAAFLANIRHRNFELIDKELQSVEIDFLREADLLFIDSSHVAKIGSDVNYEILEILPQLKKDAIIHWHDIMMPTDYWKDWTYSKTKFWNESYLLHAFMLFNDAYEIIWASRYMQLNYSHLLKEQFSYFDPAKHRCTSFWIKKIK
jgi:hypothetical protein